MTTLKSDGAITLAPQGCVPDWEGEWEKIRRFARYEALSILILGETGTGKTRLARLIHDGSPRREKPFVEVDCASIPATMAESELFGHVRGAFTDAHADRSGKMRKAHAGTLFLDEIGELDLSVQAKLLKALEDKVIMPLGSEQRIAVDLRLIAATNRDLEAMAAEGRFRRDLLERIKQAPIRMPPLRERKAEIASISAGTVAAWNESTGEAKRLGDGAMRAMESYPWPGNIRELVNAVRYACALCPGEEILPEHLPESLTRASFPISGMAGTRAQVLPERGLSLKQELRDYEWGYFRLALERSGGNAAKAAELLDMSGHAFRKALRERFARRAVEA